MKSLTPTFQKRATLLSRCLPVTMEDLTEFDWRDYLSEENEDEHFSPSLYGAAYLQCGRYGECDVTREMEEERQSKQKITVCLRSVGKKPTPMWN